MWCWRDLWLNRWLIRKNFLFNPNRRLIFDFRNSCRKWKIPWTSRFPWFLLDAKGWLWACWWLTVSSGSDLYGVGARGVYSQNWVSLWFLKSIFSAGSDVCNRASKVRVRRENFLLEWDGSLISDWHKEMLVRLLWLGDRAPSELFSNLCAVLVCFSSDCQVIECRFGRKAPSLVW